MRKIPLITGGTITAADMGFCTVHEHIVPAVVLPHQRETAFTYSLKRLQHAYDVGVRTVIDVSPAVDIRFLREVVSQTAMQVVACTGFYLASGTSYDTLSEDDFLNHMLDEYENGIQGTDIKPGIIKVATSNAMPQGWEERLLLAAGRAQRETGLPVCVHSVTGFQHQQALLEKGGADLTKVYFSHVEANQGWEGRDFEAQIALMEHALSKGSALSFNNFGNWSHTPEACMATLIKRLAQDGYADRMMATLDFVYSFVNDKPVVLWEDICADKDQRDYAYIVTHVIPWMRAQGIDEEIIHRMNHENPVRIFA